MVQKKTLILNQNKRKRNNVKRDKKLIEEHKQRMYDMRFMGIDWQLTHQKRWDDNTLCWVDKCDCEEKK